MSEKARQRRRIASRITSGVTGGVLTEAELAALKEKTAREAAAIIAAAALDPNAGPEAESDHELDDDGDVISVRRCACQPRLFKFVRLCH